MKCPKKIVFLVDVDDTLLDNDRIQDDLKRHLEQSFGAACRDRYWAIQEELFVELGYRDFRYMREDRDLDTIRHDPRFRQLLREYENH